MRFHKVNCINKILMFVAEARCVSTWIPKICLCCLRTLAVHIQLLLLVIYAYILWHRTTKFDTLTYTGRGLFLIRSASPPIPSERGISARQFGGSPPTYSYRFDLERPNSMCNTHAGRVLRGQPHHCIVHFSASRGFSAVAEFPVLSIPSAVCPLSIMRSTTYCVACGFTQILHTYGIFDDTSDRDCGEWYA